MSCCQAFSGLPAAAPAPGIGNSQRRFRRAILDDRMGTHVSRLTAVKLLHTAIWALMAGCIVAVPIAAWFRELGWAAALSAPVFAECAILALNRFRCPLTDVAARHTEDRAPNFDIYLPEWLARHNKAIFGTLFVLGELVLFWRWAI